MSVSEPDPMRMNAVTPAEQQSLRLVDIIDFKWLMVSEGVHVHVERLQADAAYARSILARAAQSKRQAVRVAASRLATLLGVDPAA